MSGDIAAAWSKLEGYAARLALVVHLIRVAAGDPDADAEAIDEKSVAAGVTLSRWFGNEASRLYELIGGKGESAEARELRQLVSLVREKGGRITVRDLMRASRRYRPGAKIAESALQMLVQRGVGRWEIQKTGGRERRDFVLNEPGPSNAGDTCSRNTGETDLLSPSQVSTDSQTELVI